MRTLAVACGNFSIRGMVMALMSSGMLALFGATNSAGLNSSSRPLLMDDRSVAVVPGPPLLPTHYGATGTPSMSMGMHPTPRKLVVYFSWDSGTASVSPICCENTSWASRKIAQRRNIISFGPMLMYTSTFCRSLLWIAITSCRCALQSPTTSVSNLI
jgi:hypothetical protein